MLEFPQNVTVDLNVELTNNVINSVHVNQYEHKSREINIYVKKDGIDYPIPSDLTVNIRIHKSNGYDIYKTIGKDIGVINGNIITISVDESMTIAPGRQTCDIEFIDSNGNRLYSTKFYINVHKSALDDNNIKDNDDYSTVQSLAGEAKEYATLSKSYAVGTENEVRESDSTDNAKFYKEQAETNANNALEASEDAKSYANEASTLASNALRDAQQAASSARQASGSAMTASDKASQSANYATKTESFLHGGTDTRENEDIDNSKYYYEQAKSISASFAGALRPMGTVTFANLPMLSLVTEGDMYNVSDQFTTNSSFKEGEGNVIPAGANVYKTVDGYWDVLAGSPVTGVKGNAEDSYRKGNVNLTPENIGARPATETPYGCRGYAKSITVATPGWIRITSGIYYGTSLLLRFNKGYSYNSSDSCFISICTGYNSAPTITQLGSRFNGKAITKIRCVYNASTIYVELYAAKDISKESFTFDILGFNGFSISEGSIPSGYLSTELTLTNTPIASNISPTVTTANNALQDGNGNVIVSTYLPKTGGTLTGGASDNTGYISARSKSGSWTNGMTLSNAAFSVSNEVTDTGYYPVLAAKTKSGNFWNIGTFQDNVGLYGFKAGRTANGTDWSISVDTNNGDLTTTGNVNVKGEGLDLYWTTPYIDFHYNNSTSDYTTRLIERSSGTLTCTGALYTPSTIRADGGFSVVAEGLTYTALLTYTIASPIYSVGVNSKSTGAYYLHLNCGIGSYGIDMWASDTKLKKNILQTKVDNVLDKIAQVEFIEFDWKENSCHVNLGISANQLEKIIPDAVYEVDQSTCDNDYDTLKNIDGTVIDTYCLKAIQELYTKTKELEKELSHLKK